MKTNNNQKLRQALIQIRDSVYIDPDNNRCHSDIDASDLREICDAALAAPPEPIGNSAKLREAVAAVVKVGFPHNFQREAPHIREYCYEITRAIKKCFDALSAPPCNCDVGTPSERTNRYVAFCNSHARCADCPCDKIAGDCEFSWGDMPYSEGDNNANK